MHCIQIVVAWPKVKSCIDDCGNYLNWTDLGTEYKIVTCHKVFMYVCTIEKDDPRSADQADFEDNYKD